jgi:hypothetical protein
MGGAGDGGNEGWFAVANEQTRGCGKSRRCIDGQYGDPSVQSAQAWGSHGWDECGGVATSLEEHT